MGTSAARNDEHPPGPAPKTEHASAERRLRLVRPEEFATIAEQAEEATGENAGLLLGLLTGVILSHLPEETQQQLFTGTTEPGPAEIAQWLRTGEVLQTSLREFMAGLRRSAPTEVNSTEVRKHWADYLELVRASEHTIYVTQHGKRVAALVPPYVAESYESEQSWFWTREWQEREREADADIADGRVTRFESDEAFLAALADEVEGT